jgi:hypothetical protein
VCHSTRAPAHGHYLEQHVRPLRTTRTTNHDAQPVPTPAPRAIFRREALQHYIQNQERIVLPRLVTPRAFNLLWVLAALTMIGGLTVAFWPWLDQMPALWQGLSP